MAISVFFPLSRAAQPEAWGLTLLGAGFPHRILSPTGLVSKLTDFLSSPSYIIVQSPTQYLLITGHWDVSLPLSLEWHVWLSLIGNNCHAVHRSLSSGASAWLYRGIFPCPILSAKPAYANGICNFCVFGMACLAGSKVNIQHMLPSPRKDPHLGFELGSMIPFSTTVTVAPSMPPIHASWWVFQFTQDSTQRKYCWITVNYHIYGSMRKQAWKKKWCRAILNQSWRQHPTRHQLYGHLPPITKTIQVRRTRHAGHCWRSKGELISDVPRWTPAYGQAKAGRSARTYIQQVCEDTGCSPENLPKTMNDREKWRERVRDIRASSATWWLWWDY